MYHIVPPVESVLYLLTILSHSYRISDLVEDVNFTQFNGVTTAKGNGVREYCLRLDSEIHRTPVNTVQ